MFMTSAPDTSAQPKACLKTNIIWKGFIGGLSMSGKILSYIGLNAIMAN